MTGETPAVHEALAVYAPETTETERVPEGYKPSEVGVIPEDWEIVPISQTAQNIIDYRGRTPRKLGMSWGGGNIPALSARNVKMGFIDFNEETYFSSDALYKRWMTNGDLRKDDIIFTMEAPLGNVALIPDGRKYILSQRTILLQTNPTVVLSKYLAQLMRSINFQRLLSENATGSTATGIQRSKLEKLKVLLPPLHEQRAIAAALSDVDALISALDELISKKRAVKIAAMQQLLTGNQRLPGFSGEWEVKRLGDLGECLRGVSYSGDADLSPHETDETVRLLRSNNVQNAAVVTTELQFVTPVRVSGRQMMRFGDILVCMANGSKDLVGKAATFDVRDGHNYTFGAFMGCFRTNSNSANSAFVFSLFQTGLYRSYITNLLAGSSINNLKPSDIESLDFQIPSLEEQTVIAAVLSDMDAEIEALEGRREKTRRVKRGMMQELLTGRTRLV